VTVSAQRERAGGGARGRRGAAVSEAAPRTGAKRAVMDTIRQLPSYLRLLVGLMTDGRVSAVDKLLVVGAIAYILSPADLIPDFIPFLGQVDDVFLLTTSLQRLIGNSGRKVLLAHWTGDASELSDLNLTRVLSAAAFFLPRRMRRRLKMLGR
jgi:uncharacterized membrane protein YkvA (DUF1232 family)